MGVGGFMDGQISLFDNISNSKKQFDLNSVPKNKEIFESFLVMHSKIINSHYKNISCSVSGGSDSDIMVDMLSKLDAEKKAKYICFDTGLEYEATKRHIKYLEQKYGIIIEVIPAQKPIPTCCKEYGQPFLSKRVSDYIARLQSHNFKWEDKSFDELYSGYPNCKVALRWWCNLWGQGSKFNIEYNKWLKEFIILNPPTYNISNKCCYYAKKAVAIKYQEDNNIDLSIVGVRKSEGGTRASAYKNCFTANEDGVDEYRPLFWYRNETKSIYEEYYKVAHSDCYCKYGLKRTGCAGCPFGQDFEFELEVIKAYEPKLYKAVNNIFGESYEYTRRYHEFRKQMEHKRN